MKKIVFPILQLILFLLVFLVGSLWEPFHFEHVLIATPGTTRIFIADGILLMFALYILIVLVQILRKRLRTSAPWTTLAVILAAVFGLMMKFGFKTLSAF
jgi:glucan phosphoethanolaminetransferase (alkaline phosphatase superfamily)